MNYSNSYSKVQDSYRDNRPIINRPDFTNKDNYIHNNVHDNIMDEHVVEYRINIDSMDRDIKIYPNPFSFTVKFNPPSSGNINTEINSKGKLKVVNDFFAGPPKPHINKEFKNVKYIKLESIVIPQYGKIIEGDTEYEFEKECYLPGDRFLSVVIKELTDDTIANRTFCTSDGSMRIDTKGNSFTPPRPFCLLYPDKIVGHRYYISTPCQAIKQYKSSRLGNIKQLTIQLYNSQGELLTFENLFTFDQLMNYNGSKNLLDDLRHPLHRDIQIHAAFTIGVVENQINTSTNY